MSFQTGESGNHRGRPKGSYGGRIQALAALDRMLGKKRNQAVLSKALEDEFVKDPVRFFKTFVMPLLPRESKLKLDEEGVVQWRSLLGTEPEAQEKEEGIKDKGYGIQDSGE
ncbi:MAG: hypothetical protein LAT83_11740 [Kiritimatiellae bacterium]|nr:hypothetical protein [Kiritimatiellia bacterium]